MKFRGIYDWKLINKETGEIEGYGEQENLVTDSMVNAFDSRSGIQENDRASRIVLSTTSTPLPAAEYREYGVAAAAISRDRLSSSLSNSYDHAAGLLWCTYNFDPPGTTQTYTIFGLDLYAYDWYYFQSFIELTTSVTQTTSQYLYVKYTLYTYYDGALVNGCTNDFVKAYYNELVNFRLYTLAYRTSDSWVYLTPYRAPSDSNLCGRNCGGYLVSIASNSGYNYGCRYGQSPIASYGTTDIPGPIGVPIWLGGSVITGVFPSDDIVPSYSRVFTHIPSRYRYVFSDAAYPPSSRASITLSGTPTNKAPIICRLKITQTGDASDIVDETFTTNYASSDQLTVSQDDWAVNDIVQVSSTGTLPSPLAASTDYYIVSKTGTSPSVLIELSLSEGGSVIELTSDGSGTHTISRQITGRYRLTMEPLTNKLRAENDKYYGLKYFQMYAMVDCDGEDLSYSTSGHPGYAVMCRYGEYIYSVQYNADYTRLMVCRQMIYTPEASQPLHSLFGTSGIYVRGAEMGKGTYANIAYINTTQGIWKYDLSSPATPTQMTITGMADSDVTDLSFDEVTEYLWAGHQSTAITRIDLSTNTAIDYTSASGPLAGMGSSQFNCYPGALTAHNGYVCYFRYMSSSFFVMLDSVGYCYSSSYGSFYGSATIQKSTGNFVLRTNSGWFVLSVSGITGPGTGSFSTVESYNPSWTTSYPYMGGKMLTVSDTIYSNDWPNNIYDSINEFYEIGVGLKNYSSDASITRRVSYDVSNYPPSYKNPSIPIEFDENGLGVYGTLSTNIFSGFTGGAPFGWTGSAWVKDNANDRQIVKTGTQVLTNGMSVAFNNATGENWDDQFVQDELFTFVISPVLIKDNLQEYSVRVRSYYCGVKRVEDWTTTCAAQVRIPECPLGSSPDPDFRDLDWDLAVTSVYDVTTATYLTRVSSPPATPSDGEYSVTGLLDGLFEFNANQVGDTIRLTYNYTVYW